MKSEYWKEHWNNSAKENKDVRLASGWGNRTIQEILSSINDTAQKLELKCNDKMLDVGCGAGLFEMAFTNWITEISGVDYSKEMVAFASDNCKEYKNIDIRQANILELPFKDEVFDKVLVNSVIQYLDDTKQVKKAFEELKRVTKKRGIVLIALIPDEETRKEFLRGYHTLGLAKEELKRKLETAEKIIWFNRKELENVATECGFKSIRITMPINSFQKKYYYDLILEK